MIKEKGFVNKKEFARSLKTNEPVIEGIIAHLIQKGYLKSLDDDECNVCCDCDSKNKILNVFSCAGCHKVPEEFAPKSFIITTKGLNFIETVTRARNVQ
jgi:hypothetical protein